MLSFARLSELTHHIHRLQDIVARQDIFVVGGAIRDLLLGTVETLTDIDLTGSGSPEDRRTTIQLPETERSRFRTEKFGTMTLVHKTDPEVFYEITPFREESGYADNRHPDQIVWSHNLLADSKRRDFRINALYRTPITLDHLPIHNDQTPLLLKDDIHLLTICKQWGGCILVDTGTVLLQEQALIEGRIHNNTIPDTLPQVTQQNNVGVVSHRGILLDPQHGLDDLIHRKICAVGNATERFTEDALRILRGLRFVNTINQCLPDADKQNSGFDIDKKTRRAMQETAPLVAELSPERLHMELMKVFSWNNPFGYIALLRELEVLSSLFPALAHTVDNRQPIRYHPFDTFNHTLLTLWHCQRLTTDPLTKFAMLYHDVGKPEQYAFMDAAVAANPDNPDRTGYIAHPEIGVRLAREDFGRLAFSQKQIEQICRYIKRHHRPGEILDSKRESWTKKVRELLSEGGYDATINLYTIAIADRLGQYNPLQTPAISELEELKEITTDLFATEGQFTMKQLAINGNDLMSHFHLAPGPLLGELLQKAFERVMEDLPERNNGTQILGYIHGLPKITKE